MTNQSEIMTYEIKEQARPVPAAANQTSVETNPIRLPANRMYQGMSLRPSKATEAISTIRIQEIAATLKGPRNNEGRGVIYRVHNSRRIINRLSIKDEMSDEKNKIELYL